MQIKNNLNLIIQILGLITFGFNISAEEFNITAKEILIDKDNEIIVGKGSVKAIDSMGRVINGNKITYEKSREFLTIEGNAEIFDLKGNILKTNKATYDQKFELIITYGDTELKLKMATLLNQKIFLIIEKAKY